MSHWVTDSMGNWVTRWLSHYWHILTWTLGFQQNLSFWKSIYYKGSDMHNSEKWAKLGLVRYHTLLELLFLRLLLIANKAIIFDICPGGRPPGQISEITAFFAISKNRKNTLYYQLDWIILKSWTNKAIVMTKTFNFGLWCRNSHTNWLLCAGMKWQNEAHHFLHGIVTLMVDNWRFDLLSRKKPARSSSSSSPYVFGINDNIIIIFIVDFDVMVICDRILHE